jgi:hypothetical protein
MRAEIETGKAGTGRIALDGVDISKGVNGFSLDASVGELTRMHIRLPAVDFTFSGEVSVRLDPRVYDALVAMGWTPPKDNADA